MSESLRPGQYVGLWRRAFRLAFQQAPEPTTEHAVMTNKALGPVACPEQVSPSYENEEQRLQLLTNKTQLSHGLLRPQERTKFLLSRWPQSETYDFLSGAKLMCNKGREGREPFSLNAWGQGGDHWVSPAFYALFQGTVLSKLIRGHSKSVKLVNSQDENKQSGIQREMSLQRPG